MPDRLDEARRFPVRVFHGSVQHFRSNITSPVPRSAMSLSRTLKPSTPFKHFP